MKIRRIWWLLAALALAAVLAVTWLRRGPQGIPVEAATVGRGTVEDAVTNSQAGTVMSRRRSSLGAAAAGRVVAIEAREGARVHRGEIVVQLDDATARSQVQMAERDVSAARAALASARATAQLAELDLTRTTQLFERKLASQSEMDQARAREASARAGLDGARAQLDRAQASAHFASDALRNLGVIAPFDGVVTRRFVELGEAVVPGEPVLEVLDPDSLYVSAPIDEMDIGRLGTGLPARITLDPYPGVEWNGIVTRVAPFVNDVQLQNRTLEVEVALPPAAGLPVPKPGASADVEIVLRHKDDALRVPTAALLEGHRVLVVSGGRARSREVKTGLHNWDWTEVLSGLAPGERVITTLDRPGLKDGAAVAVTRPPRTTLAPAASARLPA